MTNQEPEQQAPDGPSVPSPSRAVGGSFQQFDDIQVLDDVDDVEDAPPAAPFTPIPPPRSAVTVSQQAPSQDPPRRWQALLLGLFALVLVASLVGVFVNQFTKSRAVPPSPDAPYALVSARDFDPAGTGDVPDPYYDTIEQFREVHVILERSMPLLLDHLRMQTAPD